MNVPIIWGRWIHGLKVSSPINQQGNTSNRHHSDETISRRTVKKKKILKNLKLFKICFSATSVFILPSYVQILTLNSFFFSFIILNKVKKNIELKNLAELKNVLIARVLVYVGMCMCVFDGFYVCICAWVVSIWPGKVI